MRELFLAFVSVLLQIGAWFALGNLLTRFFKIKEDAAQELVFGYLLYFALFELFTVPMTLTWAPLSVLTKVWVGVLAVLALCSAVLNGRRWLKRLGSIGRLLSEHSYFLVFAGLAVAGTCLYAVLYTGNTHDAAYYVGATNTAVYTDTLWRYNPYTGLPVTNFNTRYIFSSYPMHNAVWCQLLGLPALIETKVVMSALNVFVADLLIYLIGKRLFRGRKRPAVLMLCFWALLQMFSYTQYTTGAFLLTRGYEGKALLANISIPAVLYASIWFWQESRNKQLWAVLFLAALSALTFSGSSIIFPVVLAAGMLPVMILRKRLDSLPLFVLCLIPQAIYAAVYFGTRAGFLVFPAW